MNNDHPKKDPMEPPTLVITEEDKIKAMEDVERRRIEALAEIEKAAGQPSVSERPPIALSKTEKKLWLYHSSELRAMEEAAAAQIRQLGQTIKIMLVEQFAQEHGIVLGPGQYKFSHETMEFIDWPLSPKVRMPESKIPSGAGGK